MPLSDKQREEIKLHFQANMLGGDDVNDCGGAMLSAESVLEYCIDLVDQELDRRDDTIRQEERRKTIEEIIKYIPQEDNTLKDVGHNLAQASLYGFQRGFNYCRKIVLSTLENKKHE